MGRRNVKYIYRIAKARYTKHPIQIFAECEAEIASYGLPLPPPWPWAIDSDGVVDMALRLLQLEELLVQLKRNHPTKPQHKSARS